MTYVETLKRETLTRHMNMDSDWGLNRTSVLHETCITQM